jgi:four helix bundle protein
VYKAFSGCITGQATFSLSLHFIASDFPIATVKPLSGKPDDIQNALAFYDKEQVRIQMFAPVNNARGYRDLIVYRKAFNVAMDVFRLSKKFPIEERYALTDQIRRSSRSVCSCVAEGYRKRIYERAFVNKMTDADAENGETIVWLEFAIECGYIDHVAFDNLETRCDEIGRMLNSMTNSPSKFLPKQKATD